jgi:hypothetical protein
LRFRWSSTGQKEKRIVAKQILQPLRLDIGIEAILPSLDRVARPRKRAKLMQALRTLAAYIRERRRRKPVESFTPRKSHEDDRRLEFERFLYW